jgi:CBS domain containing-hemolysin-like protein
MFIWWLIAMAALALGSAFFSCSEAALFYLRRQDRRSFASGNSAQRIAARLLDDPDRLLSAVLFWNLVINIAYFAIASIVSVGLEQQGRTTAAGGFAVASLLALIFFSEMLPKSLAVLQSRLLSALLAVPLAAAVRAIDPIAPLLRTVTLLSRRLFLPRFEAEPYLELGDLERAIELSTSDSQLLEREQQVLNRIISLSELRADELMRPRTQFVSYRAPVALDDLQGRMTASGYLLIREPDSDEVAAAIPLKHLSEIPEGHLEQHAVPVAPVPWCANVATVLEEMRRRDRRVASVVNEHGETIGILTFDDILATVFGQSPSRSGRLLHVSSIEPQGSGVWHVTGMTSLRRIRRHFDVRLPESKSVTVAGILHEVLQRMPEEGDTCVWGPFRWEVLEVGDRGHLRVRIEQEGDA